jgi:hypothetical protein
MVALGTATTILEIGISFPTTIVGGALLVGFVVCPSNKHNDAHLILWQGLVVVLVPMTYFWK